MTSRLLVLVLAVGCGDDAAVPPVDATPADALDPSTALAATFGATTRVLDRAYYGITASSGALHVEAYLGGDPGCPTQSSRTPDYTLIFGAIPEPTSTTPTTSPANLIDFRGDLLADPAPARATHVSLVPTAWSMPRDPAGTVAFDAELGFEGGAITGHFHATHCASLDAAR